MSNDPVARVSKKADIIKLLDEHLSAGTFRDRINQALSDCAIGATVTGRQAEVTIKMVMKPIGEKGESHQVEMAHTVSFKRPTDRGEATNKDTTKTALYVGYGGHLDVYPEPAKQEQMFTSSITP